MTQDSKVNILMVDDQPAKLLSYEVILGELGENLLQAHSGREALEMLLKYDIAVVLMDVSMPEMDGFELADLIRQHPRFQKTAIIFISGVHLSDEDRINGYRKGAVDYISVPVVPEVLRAKVSVFCDLHRKTRLLESLNQELESRVAERSELLRQTNLQLSQRVTELETIMQVLPVGVSIAQDAECTTISSNTALEQMLSGINDDGSSHNSPAPALLLQQAAATGTRTPTLEMEIPRGDGTHTHLLASASPLLDDSGTVRGAVGAFFDVTDRKKLMEELRERADLLELASEAIMVRDEIGRVHFWNSGAEALYGWQRDEVKGKNIHELLISQVNAPWKQIEDCLTKTGKWQGNITQQCKDGTEVIVASRMAQGDGGAILEINRDITAQIRTEEALRKSERLAGMGRVAGIIAHEINNPLESITNLFFLLRDHPSLDQEARQYARIAEQELQRVAHITKQTLSFYREAQQPVQVSICDILDEVIELQSRRMVTTGIQIEKRYDSQAWIHGFPGELRQVFLNLVGNAAQAMPSGGILRVRVGDAYGSDRPSQGGVSISISDTGTGIRADDAKRLFEPFFTTKEAKGNGLGLWISKGIVQKYEGSIRFRSIQLAQGRNVTCFRVVFPEALKERRHSETRRHAAG